MRHRTNCPQHRHTTPGCRACAELYRRWQVVYRLEGLRGQGPRLLPALATTRRVQGLAVTGWPAEAIAEAGGAPLNRRLVQSAMYAETARVNTRTAEAVARVYARHGGAPGRSTKAATHARLRGWVHPDRWEGLDLTDPAAVPHPDLTVVERTAADVVAEADHLARFGATWDEVATRMGVTPRTLVDYMRRVDRRDVAEALTRNGTPVAGTPRRAPDAVSA